ncbi:MAG: alpha/beta hydrolase [Sphingomonadales bacterium]|nr:alpha/beta hydrolase [Sphingomonadales bacterium]
MADTSRIAPELLGGLEFFPDLDFSQGMAPYRGASPRPPLPVPPGLEVVQVGSRMIAGAAGDPDVKLVTFDPPRTSAGPRAAVLHIHGGGFVLGDAETFSGLCRLTALQHDCFVVSVDYRLAPETTWPGSLHDCYAALRWLHDNAAELEIDPARIAVMGESAGGGHAAALALHARDQGGPAIRYMMLDAPMLDDRTGTASDPHPHCGQVVWTPQKNRFGWAALLGTEPGGADVPAAAVPARAADLAGLPPTFISVGALDLFLEEDLEWSRRLARAGVDVELHVIPGAYHGFGVAGDAPQVRQCMAWRKAALDRALG